MKNKINSIIMTKYGKIRICCVLMFFMLLFFSDNVWGYSGKGTKADPYMVDNYNDFKTILTQKGRDGGKWTYVGIKGTFYLTEKINIEYGRFRIFAAGGERYLNRSVSAHDTVNFDRQYCFKVESGAEVTFGYDKGYILNLDGGKSAFGKTMFSAGFINVMKNGTAVIDNKCVMKDIDNMDSMTQAGAVKSVGNLIVNGTITRCDGANGGGITAKGGSVKVKSGAVISACSSSTEGGGIYISNGTNFEFNGANVNGCNAKEEGGGIFITGNCKAIINDGEIYNNTSGATAGGIFSGYGAELSIGRADGSSGPKIHNNAAESSGGGIRCNGGTGKGAGGITHLNVGEIYNNRSGKLGGGVACGQNSLIRVSKMKIYNNTAKNSGGGISITENTRDVQGGPVEVEDCVIESNHSDNNGGGICSVSSINISRTNILRNNCNYEGGGINIRDGNICTFYKGSRLEKNDTERIGGGVCISNNAIFKMNGNDIYGNHAKSKGSGVYVDGILDMSGDAVIHASNNVYLKRDRYINVSGYLTYSSLFCAMIESEVKQEGTGIVKVSYPGASGRDELYIKNNNGLTVTQKFCLTEEKTGTFLRETNNMKNYSNDWIVISALYKINFNANAGKGATVGNMPDNIIKYWNEALQISYKKPYRDGYSINSDRHWNSNSDGKGQVYKPGTVITENRNMTLYAQWEKDDVVPINIVAPDRYYAVNQNVILNFEEILKKARVYGTDDITKNCTLVIESIYDSESKKYLYVRKDDEVKPEDYINTKKTAEYRISLTAYYDKDNLTAKANMNVYVQKTDIDIGTVRFISREYLYTLDDKSRWNKYPRKAYLVHYINTDDASKQRIYNYSASDVKQIKEKVEQNKHKVNVKDLKISDYLKTE